MANAKEKAEVKEDKAVKNESYAIRKMGKIIRVLLDELKRHIGPGIIAEVERRSGVDINGDGKIGSSRLPVMLMVLLLSVGTVFAGTTKWRPFNPDIWGDALFTGSDVTHNASLTVDGEISGVSSGNITTSLSTVSIASSDAGNMYKTTLTFANVPLAMQEAGPSTNATAYAKVGDFPAGRILVHGVVVDNLTMATNTVISSARSVTYSMGTTAASGPALTGTEVDLCPTNSMIVSTNYFDSALSASAQFDGTSTAKDIYVNQLINTFAGLNATTNLVSGTAIITWSNLGDN